MSPPIGPIDYAAGAPDGYRCTRCGMRKVRLWREYQTMARLTELFCVECAVGNQTRPDRPMTTLIADLLRGDQIGWLIPAVPTEDGDTFWGYTSVPDEGVAWWYRLTCAYPLRRDARATCPRPEKP